MRRRRLLQLGLGSAVALALGGGALALVQPGLQDGRLTTAGRLVFTHAARGLLDGSLPDQPALQAPAREALLVRLDGVVQTLPAHAQSELSQLLAVLATGGGRRALAGLSTPWPDADVQQIQAALQSMRTSSMALRQQAYQALHDLAAAAWFSDRGTWSTLGYPGPVEL